MLDDKGGHTLLLNGAVTYLESYPIPPWSEHTVQLPKTISVLEDEAGVNNQSLLLFSFYGPPTVADARGRIPSLSIDNLPSAASPVRDSLRYKIPPM